MQEDFDPKPQDMKSLAVSDADKALAQVAAALAQAQGGTAHKAQPAKQQEADAPVDAVAVQEPATSVREDSAQEVSALELELESVPELVLENQAPQPEQSNGDVLQKEISSAVPDRTVDMAKSVAKSVLKTDDVVRPFQQKDDKFRDFFTTSVVVLPKDMTATVHTLPALEDEAETKKLSFFDRIRAFFARDEKAEQEDDAFDQQEESDVFFPEEEALKNAFASPMDEPVPSISFSEDTAEQTPAQPPRGKVHFVAPEEDASIAQQVVDAFEAMAAPQSLEDSASCKLADAMDDEAPAEDDFTMQITTEDDPQAQSLEDSAACKLAEAMDEPDEPREPLLQDLFAPQSLEDSASCKLADAMDDEAPVEDDFAMQITTEDDPQAQSLEDSAAFKFAEVLDDASTAPETEESFTQEIVLEEMLGEECTSQTSAEEPNSFAVKENETPLTLALGYGREEEFAQEEEPTLGQSLREGLQAAKAGIAARCTALKTGWDTVNEQAAAEEAEAEGVADVQGDALANDFFADDQPQADEPVEFAQLGEQAETAEPAELADVAATQEAAVPQKPEYCFFGEDDDESAVLDQTGEISFEDTQPIPEQPSVFEESAHTQAKKLATEPLPEDADGIQFGLSGMRGKLMVRLFTTGVLSAGLLLLGLMAQGVVGAIPAIDPIAAPVPFLMVNLVLLLGAMGVCYPIFIEGCAGLWKKPSADTVPAIASLAAFVQLLLCLMLVDSFEVGRITLCAAPATLVLFASTLGNVVMSRVIQGNFDLATAGVPHHLAYQVQQKDVLHTLTQKMDLEHPNLLVSRPVQQISGFLEKSFAPRSSEKRAQWSAYALLAGAVLAFLITLIKGQGFLGAISNMAVLLCIGAPLCVSLLSALPSLFMHRAAARVGAMVPGWREMEVLENTNLLTVNATDLFPAQCAQIHGIKTFQKERVDLAISYATSLLMHSGGTLKDLFAGMIEYNEKLLYPVSDFESRQGMGFIGWCENYRVIVGTRALMKAEGIALPVRDYEDRYSKNGRRQVLYLAVSGQLYAMFLIGYRGEKGIAQSLRVLRREQIRLLVRCDDPTLTATRIEMAYHLPRGFVRLLSKEQTDVYDTATTQRPQSEGVMMHLGSFTSLVGGLKAAFAAASAERAASAMMLISVAFSVLLCLFLCIADGLMQIALVAILLYQIAWSVLTLGIVLVKKFS